MELQLKPRPPHERLRSSTCFFYLDLRSNRLRTVALRGEGGRRRSGQATGLLGIPARRSERLAATHTTPHLLLVDDRPYSASRSASIWSTKDMRLRVLDNGRDALAYLNDSKRRCIAAGLGGCPTCRGSTGCGKCAAPALPFPVIFLTVLSDDIYEQAALEGGARRFHRPKRAACRFC